MSVTIRAIIFDCFGVIITDGLEAVVQQLEKTDSQARGFISGIIKQNNVGLITPEESNRHIAEYLDVPVGEWRKMVTVGEVKNADLLAWIVSLRPRYKTALLSNIGQDSLRQRFSAVELSRLFDEVIISGDVGIIKPDPQIYHLTAERLAVIPEECVFLDDRQTHVQGAISVGMHGIHYQTFRQAKAELEVLLSGT